jgi:hypothetical protein
MIVYDAHNGHHMPVLVTTTYLLPDKRSMPSGGGCHVRSINGPNAAAVAS